MTYDIESIVIKVLANNSGNLVIPLKWYSDSWAQNCPYDWKISVDNWAETSYSGTWWWVLTIATWLVAWSEHLVIIKPTTVDYQWARAFGTDWGSEAVYITEIVQDASYMWYWVSATSTWNYFKAFQYQNCSNLTNTVPEVLPDTVTTIWEWFRAAQFHGTSITQIVQEVLPDSVITIWWKYRRDLYRETKITTPAKEVMSDNVTSIWTYFRSRQYYWCTLLVASAKEVISSSLTSIPDNFRDGQYHSCQLLETANDEYLPEWISSIGNYFRNMQYVWCWISKTAKEIMPTSITTIWTNCRYNQYYNCLWLKEITWEAIVSNASIWQYYRRAQYYNCTALVKARLAAQSWLTNYRVWWCFSATTNPMTITILWNVVDAPTTNSASLTNASVEKIYIDSALVSWYKNSLSWSNINDDKFFEIWYIQWGIELLLSAWNAVDKQYTISGKKESWVIKQVLTWIENWSWDSNNNIAILSVSWIIDWIWDVICSHWPSQPNTATIINDSWCIRWWKLYCYTTKSDLTTFKNWLVQEYTDWTPVIVLMQWLNYISSTVQSLDFNTKDWENIIDIIQSWPNKNLLGLQIVADIATWWYTANVFNWEDYSVESNWTEISEQDAWLTAWENITIENNVISAKDTTYTAWDNVTIDNNEISVDLDWYQTIDNMVQDLDDADHSHYPTAKAVKDAIVSGWWWDVSWPNSSVDWNVVLFDWTTWKTIKDSGVSLSDKQDTLTAWNWIDIDANNKISTTFVYWESTTAAATVQKEVSIPSITELNVWQVIIVKPTVTSTVANSTLKLNNFDAYAMLYNGSAITTSTDSVVWTANVPSMFYLDEVSGTRYWRFLGHWLDNNSTYTLNRLIDPSRYHVWTGTYAFSRYSLVMEKADWTWEKITNTAAAYSTWTTKTVNTNWFRLWHIRYYNTTTNLANWALVATSALDIQAPSVNASYSFNCGTAPWWAVWTPIYLVGSMWADWLFYLDTTQRWSTQLPSTNDWKLYIKLWTSLSADNSTFSLIAEKPIYYYDNGIKVYWQADNKQDVISDLATIRSWATLWATAIQPNDNISELTNDVWYITSAPVTSVNNQTWDVVLTIPTTASDVWALPNTTKYWAALTLEVNSSTYVVTATLKDQDWNTLGTAQTIDLPLESVVVSWSYDDSTKKIILTLQSWSTVEFSVADLVSWLQSEITSTNKLSSDLVDDTNHTNKFVTAAEKTKLSNLSWTNTWDETWTTIKTKLWAASASQDWYLTSTDWSTFNNKQNAISDLATIRSWATCGSTSVQPWDLACYAQCCDMPDTSCLAQCCDIPTNNCQLTNGCGYTTCTWTLSTCSDITTALWYTPYSAANPSWYTSCTWTLVQSDIANLAQCCDIPTNNNQLSNWCGYTTCTWTLVASDIACLAQCCDIPTDNCQLANSCWFTTCTWTVSTCADIISKLWYTPYNSTNPNGYTSCTGTLTQSDLACYAQCCDIPTNNCQLINWCWYIKGINCSDVTTALWFTPYNSTNPAWYTTCTWTLTSADLACYACCCDIPTNNCQLTNGCGYSMEVYVTAAEYEALLPWAETDWKIYNIKL